MNNIYICFPGGKHKALTMSYDDGRREDYRLVELFNRSGIRGTFNLNSGMESDTRRIPMSEWKELYQGHEIACHTFSHPTLARCPIEQTARQILEDRERLEALTGAPVRGLAYPNGSYNGRIRELLPMLGIRYARVVQTTGQFTMPEDLYAWSGTCHHNQKLLERAGEFLALCKTQYLYLFYVWGHSYEFTDHDNWSVMERFCEMMGGQENTWYATNIEIADYMDAAGRLQFTAAGDRVCNPSAQSVWIEVNRDAHIEIPGGALVSL